RRARRKRVPGARRPRARSNQVPGTGPSGKYQVPGCGLLLVFVVVERALAPSSPRSSSSGTTSLMTSLRSRSTGAADGPASSIRCCVRLRPVSSIASSSRSVSFPLMRATVSGVDLLDTFGRPLRDLRISVTDRCNFRCVYCMPKEVYGRDHRFLDRRELLTFEEIARVARVFAARGVRKIRITGGEPLVRRDLERLIEQLRPLGVELTLTTNGSLLPQKARLLADAGLDRVTVSLDSLDDAQFRALNDVDFPVDRVLEGIAAAADAGLPVKVNAVVKRGANEDQIVPMARLFREQGHTLRFIEYMDVGHTNGWRLDDVVPAAEIVAVLDRELGLEAVVPAYR